MAMLREFLRIAPVSFGEWSLGVPVKNGSTTIVDHHCSCQFSMVCIYIYIYILYIYILYIYITGWWFGTMEFLWLSIQLGMSSSQLTNSYLSEGLKPPTRLHSFVSMIYRQVYIPLYQCFYKHRCNLWQFSNVFLKKNMEHGWKKGF